MKFGKSSYWAVTAIAYSRDGALVIAGDDNGKVVVRERATGKKVRSLPGATSDEVSDLCISPDGKELAGAFSVEGIFVWDLATGKKRKLWDQPCVAVGYTSRGLLGVGHEEYAFVGGRSQVGTLADVPKLKLDYADRSAIGGDRVASFHDGRLAVWNPLEPSLVQVVKTKCDVQSLRIAKGKLLASEAFRQMAMESFEVWDLATNTLVAKHRVKGVLDASALSPDGKRVAYAYTPDGREEVAKLAVWNVDGKVIEIDVGKIDATEPGTCVAWSPDGKRLAMGTENGLVYEVPSR